MASLGLISMQWLASSCVHPRTVSVQSIRHTGPASWLPFPGPAPRDRASEVAGSELLADIPSPVSNYRAEDLSRRG